METKSAQMIYNLRYFKGVLLNIRYIKKYIKNFTYLINSQNIGVVSNKNQMWGNGL